MNGGSERWRVVPGMALCALLAGCASQGPLRPPSLNLPAAVRHAEAARVGNTVELSWTNPIKTSDGVALTLRRHGAGALTAELCRSEQAQTAHCTPIARIPVTSGATSVYRDALPTDLASGADRGLYYRLRVVNAQGNGAAWTEVVTAAGTPPRPLTGLQAYPVANGMFLHWQPEEGDVMFRVSRGTDTAHSTLLRLAPGSLIVTGEAKRYPREWAGTVDTGGHAGQEQRYVGFRQTTLRAGGTVVVLKSDTVTVVVQADAKLPPPAPPTRLEAIVNTLGSPEVDLVWQPPDDASVTGYRVYRQDGEAQAVLLTAEPTRGFTFADAAVKAGHRYSYRVCAVNASGESAAAVATAALP